MVRNPIKLQIRQNIRGQLMMICCRHEYNKVKFDCAYMERGWFKNTPIERQIYLSFQRRMIKYCVVLGVACL